MKDASYKLFADDNLETIIAHLADELELRNESPFWTDKVVPFSHSVLSILVPLRDNDMLFTPEGVYQEELTPELFFSFCDFVSLKTLYFSIESSNEAKKLMRTKLEAEICDRYREIDISQSAYYLERNGITLKKESLDFPIATYNLHQGVSNVIKSLL